MDKVSARPSRGYMITMRTMDIGNPEFKHKTEKYSSYKYFFDVQNS